MTPRERMIAAAIHRATDFVPYHIEYSAGIRAAMMRELGTEDLAAVKKEYDRDLAFLGGMSVQRTLPFGTPAQVRGESRWLLDHIGAGGGFVFAPSHMLTDDVPVANVLAMLETVAAANPATRWCSAEPRENWV